MDDPSVDDAGERVSATAAEALRAREAAIAATEAFAARLSAAILAGLESDIAPPRPAPVEVRARPFAAGFCDRYPSPLAERTDPSPRLRGEGGERSEPGEGQLHSSAFAPHPDPLPARGERGKGADSHWLRRAYAEDLRARLLAERCPARPRPAVGAFTLLDLAPGLCRYPHGEQPPYAFCGAPAVPGDSYCARHAALCRRTPEPAP